MLCNNCVCVRIQKPHLLSLPHYGAAVLSSPRYGVAVLSSPRYGAAVLSSNSPFILGLASVFTVNNSLVFTTLWRGCSVLTTLWHGCSVFTTLWRGCSVFKLTLHLHKWRRGWTAEDGQFWWDGKLLWKFVVEMGVEIFRAAEELW